MKNKTLFVGLFLLSLPFGARADFINGGFESGDFTGWTLEYGQTSGVRDPQYLGDFSPGYIPPLTVLASPNGHQAVIGPVQDPYSPFDAPFHGNYMAQINDYPVAGWDVSRISQTTTMGIGETDVYAKWGAVMEWHDHRNQSYFDISIYVNGVLRVNEQNPWTNANPWPSNWNRSGVYDPDGSYPHVLSTASGILSVSHLNVGDVVTVSMTAADCGFGAHFGYAYLDGVSTSGVPDGGNLALLTAPAVIGLAFWRRRQGAKTLKA